MKVIDLLNMIANAKDLRKMPKKVKVTTGTYLDEFRTWVWDGSWYVYECNDDEVWICTNNLDLNDEIEIIKK